MSARAIIILAFGAVIAGAPVAIAEDKTPPAAEQGASKGGDPKTGTSPPVQAGGAGVKGKPDAGAGKTDEAPKEKK